MSDASSLVDQLEEALSQGSSPGSRLKALWYATDTLLTGHYAEDQIWTFGEIIDRLAADIEVQARATLSRRLSDSANAPRQTVRKLALHDSAEVATPVLRSSRRIDDDTLVEVAEQRSQRHLAAIAERSSLSERVTAAVVRRGDQGVLRSVAANPGARFSDMSFLKLIQRSANDAILIDTLSSRKDMPRHIFAQLVAKASDTAKERIIGLSIHARADVEHAVSDIAGQVQARVGPASKEYFEARRTLKELHRRGQLGERQLRAFAEHNSVIEATVTLSLLSGAAVDIVERAIMAADSESLLIVARAAGLSWTAAQALLSLRPEGKAETSHDMNAALLKFSRLSVDAAKEVIGFLEARRKDAANDGTVVTRP